MSEMINQIKDAAAGMVDKVTGGKGDEIVDKAADLASEHGDQIDAAVDKATDAVDEKTGGASSVVTDKVDGAVDSATDQLKQ